LTNRAREKRPQSWKRRREKSQERKREVRHKGQREREEGKKRRKRDIREKKKEERPHKRGKRWRTQKRRTLSPKAPSGSRIHSPLSPSASNRATSLSLPGRESARSAPHKIPRLRGATSGLGFSLSFSAAASVRECCCTKMAMVSADKPASNTDHRQYVDLESFSKAHRVKIGKIARSQVVVRNKKKEVKVGAAKREQNLRGGSLYASSGRQLSPHRTSRSSNGLQHKPQVPAIARSGPVIEPNTTEYICTSIRAIVAQSEPSG
jgi:hypothetical protein